MNLKKLVFILTILITTQIFSFAQSLNWEWAKSAGGLKHEEAYSVSTDDIGNFVVSGNFRSTSLTFGNTTLTNKGGDDIFVVKYDPNGSVLWAKSVGGINNDLAYGVSIDTSGNIVITGVFSSPSLTIGSTTFTNSGDFDIFVIKYDPNGNVLWAKSAGGINSDIAYCVSTDVSGNIVVTGTFSSPTLTFGSTSLANKGSDDIFVVKYDLNGNILWAKSAGGLNEEYSFYVSTDVSGNIVLTGTFSSPTLSFDSTTLTRIGRNTFVVKYDPNGNVLWAKSTDGNNWDVSYSVSTDVNGNIILAGYTGSPTLTFGSTTLTNKGGDDIFVVKYDPIGNVLWAKSVGGINSDVAEEISTDASGNIVVVGYFNSITLSSGTTSLTNNGGYDIFIIKYDPNGNILWANSVGGVNTDAAYGISTDIFGNNIMVGVFGSPSVTFGSTTLTNMGDGDMFVAKLSLATGIGVVNKETVMLIAPNPFNNIALIQLPEAVNNAEIIIRDLLGERILASKFSGKEYLLEKGTMSPGVYFVEINDEINRYPISKILVE